MLAVLTTKFQDNFAVAVPWRVRTFLQNLSFSWFLRCLHFSMSQFPAKKAIFQKDCSQDGEISCFVTLQDRRPDQHQKNEIHTNTVLTFRASVQAFNHKEKGHLGGRGTARNLTRPREPESDLLPRTVAPETWGLLMPPPGDSITD